MAYIYMCIIDVRFSFFLNKFEKTKDIGVYGELKTFGGEGLYSRFIRGESVGREREDLLRISLTVIHQREREQEKLSLSLLGLALSTSCP